ncbi:LOW QUALITY PROTEIN: wings apart-like protein homolog [Anoplopoma fimbria]|uniref:LOW QUALITY PROTEIN: wings apart-like protein homolog n=1 Tax=Anoplopoma fimbria TaxID=229290 RepID=UPI0023ED555E|nr:LOW QUALITY PROTEIN: wings apart-like protein homolog [Anoplopoma fimbria]
MTSRFGKTYNRKGGEANSKFDEVFSNKKPTLTTKWGETTYKAKLGAKRPTLKSDVSELSKRPRLEDSDSDEDPFGFDSDEESKTSTLRSVSQVGVNEGAVTKTTAVQGGGTATVVTSAQGSANSTGKFTTKQTSTEGVRNNQLRYKSASDSNQKSACRVPLSNTVPSNERNFLAPQRPISSAPNTATSLKLSINAPGGSRDSQTSSSYDELEEKRNTELEPHTEPRPEPVDSIPPSPFTLRASNCKKYLRPNQSKKTSLESAENNSNKPTETAAAHVKPNSALSASASSTAANTKPAAKPTGRGGGRVRDYTVLHPSCLSVCNVTIQDSIERSIDELVTPATPADVGEAGQMKKKTDAPVSKSTRFRPTQTKTKKTKTETKLEFFGFEDKEDQGEEGPEGGMAGKSSYKIKYFGFDDLSESDSDEESSQAKEKKAKKAAAALAALSSGVDSPHTSDSQDSQASSNTDNCDFAEDSSPGGAEGQKGRSGKSSDKSKDAGSGLKKIFSGPKKSPAKAVYNARHWNQPEPEEIPVPPLSRSQTAPAVLSSSSKDSNSHKDDGLFKAPPPPPKVIKSETLPTRLNQDIVTALKCRKEHKELYTVVQHVKHFNDVVEFGENQEFTDDFEYLETGLKSSQPLNTRCLSIISLATRCAMPGFRMHLRARGKVAQVFNMLSDAPQHPNLALCTAALMYILSRDRLNMDLDRACLELMIKLLEQDQDYPADQDQLTAKEVEKVKEKIRKLCETVHNKHLDLENITTGHLAMETLLSLTSKRAGDWFKEELRLLGGLDHIIDKVKECVQNLSQEDDKENLVAALWGAERCLRVLESVTVQNPENQGYLIAYKDSQLIVSSARALRYCEDMIQRYSRALNNSSLSLSGAALPHCSFSNVGKAVEDCMRAIIGVLLNLTHDNEWGSTKTGEQEQLTVTALNCVLRVPRYIPQEQRFDVRVLGLGLLINLVEYSSRNRHCLVDMEYIVDDTCLEDSLMQPADQTQSDTAAASAPPSTAETQGDEPVKPKPTGALAALVQLFLERERAAILAEAKTDDIITEAPKPALDKSGEWQETSGEIQWVAAEPNDNQTENKDDEKKEEEDEELDLNKALQHAGKHMEDSIVASYTALLLGCLCQGSQVNVNTVRENLPKGDFSIMTEMLKKFLSFMNLTCAMGTTGQKSITRVIDYLEHL